MSLGTVGKYVLLERLGEGGMGQVFRAAADGPAGFRRELAIKQMREPLVGDERLRELFLAEARTLAELRHRNVVQVFDFDVDAGRPYLVMELLRGVPLSSLIDGAPLPPEGVALVGAELADALAAVHSTGRVNGEGGLVHGDLSPSNVMACDDGAVKLLDFGLARRSHAEPLAGPRAGKLPYLAPELLAGASPDAKTDLYAVGVALHELLSGRRLFRDEAPQVLAQRITRGEVPPLPEHVPAALRDVVLHCLARDRGARIQSARQLAKALHALHPGFGASELARHVRAAQGGPGVHEPTGTVPRAAMQPKVGAPGEPRTASAVLSPAPAAPKKRRPVLAIAGALVALLLGGTVALWPKTPQPEPQPPPASPPAMPPPVVEATPEPAPPAVEPTTTPEPPKPAPAIAKKRRPPKKRPEPKPVQDRLAPGFIADPGAR